MTLVTTLLDPVAYPVDAVADLYRARWRVETNLAHLNTILGLHVLHCQSEEIAMFAVVYNLVRAVMGEADGLCRTDQFHRRVSFIDGMRWLATAPADGTIPTFVVNPARPDRIEPRSRKRRAKKHPSMIRPRAELRKQLLDNWVVV